MPASWLPGVYHLQNLHPLFVHFPIAFLYGAILLYTLAWISAVENLAKSGFALLWLALISISVTGATGWRAMSGVMVSHDVHEQLLDPHWHFMVIAAVLTLLLTLWATAARPFPRRTRPVFMAVFLLTIVVLTKGADYGGRLVYDYNAGGNACGQPIQFNR